MVESRGEFRQPDEFWASQVGRPSGARGVDRCAVLAHQKIGGAPDVDVGDDAVRQGRKYSAPTAASHKISTAPARSRPQLAAAPAADRRLQSGPGNLSYSINGSNLNCHKKRATPTGP